MSKRICESSIERAINDILDEELANNLLSENESKFDDDDVERG